ncbi:SDR family oxidoreductase [Salipiger thiooxidans]|uniref:NAD(P)-dependent dehydrogenase, short-chain alcohol dehydrogenase family n=1 Tax=Salipiger thiooxidans TaxID=282683 RepID=A0A1G7J0X8_9RHOB|nr:SDR family oxidoreductase [Salipiger thiooxidans]EEX12548.1 3-oxoacyl-(acyl-carrier-protein) reductase [Citreicella sp. SE45]MCA0848776.1 SDR family oxidoreductase [Salipiger thiooxidans]SDF18538.1 NAD(P)-dependent dehydrogenase, short-chain alcohol dehydrogenase family [Salipiger thiooxidans]
MRLAGKIAVVTGSASGIGHETAKLFAAEGAHVVVADRDADAAAKVALELAADGAAAEAVAVDVSQEDQVKALLDGVKSRHGRLDILVNNAGYGFAGTVADTSVEDWDALFAVNVRGVFLGCKHAVPIFAAQGGGIIVNTASGGAIVGIANRAAYTASKGAVAALTRAMAIDHADDMIRVNCVAPGTIETPYFTEIFAKSPDAAALRKGLEDRQVMGRLGRPEEIARAILFLASDDATFCTGSTLVVDGGWTIR